MAARPFISYAREDRATAYRIYRDLAILGAEPWIDAIDISPGQEWESVIAKAIRNCSHFLALLSTYSVNKRGYVQKELQTAMRALDFLPPGDVFVIPIRLDDSRPRHERLSTLQQLDLFPDYSEALARLAAALGLGISANRLAHQLANHDSDCGDLAEPAPISLNMAFYESVFYAMPRNVHLVVCHVAGIDSAPTFAFGVQNDSKANIYEPRLSLEIDEMSSICMDFIVAHASDTTPLIDLAEALSEKPDEIVKATEALLRIIENRAARSDSVIVKLTYRDTDWVRHGASIALIHKPPRKPTDVLPLGMKVERLIRQDRDFD